MTYQRDPDPTEPESVLGREPRRNYARRADGSWSVFPLLLGALAIIVVGYMFLGDRFSGLDRPNSSGIEKTTKQAN